ncbi:MAG: methyltransferase domain-containing protein [Chloroflexi bacterium]|nr:MAG: methyltransferase domain-containing protein [Chloroflexota bacterium]
MSPRRPPPEAAPSLAAEIESYRRDPKFRAMLRGQEFRFTTAWGLFSPREVDLGSALLIEHLDAAGVAEDDDTIDIGCGYGAIGLVLASMAPRGETWLLDKDFVAVERARLNAEANRLTNVTTMLSNGLSAVPRGRLFDVATANLPAKVGNEMLTLILADAHAHLKPGGRLTVVTTNALRRFIERMFDELFGNSEKVKQGRLHTVTVAVKQPRD